MSGIEESQLKGGADRPGWRSSLGLGMRKAQGRRGRTEQDAKAEEGLRAEDGATLMKRLGSGHENLHRPAASRVNVLHAIRSEGEGIKGSHVVAALALHEPVIAR